MKKAYKIVFLGNTAVGKTTLITQYLYSKVHAPTPTIGIDFLTTTHEINGKAVRLQLWDTAGQERFHSIIGNYTRNTFLAIIVFSVDDSKSVDKVESWINDFVLTHNLREETNLMVVANKIDLIDKTNENMERGIRVAAKVGAKFVTASGLSREGIERMINGIDEFILEDIDKTNENDDEQQNQITIRAKINKRCCP
ncbi:small GTP-binding protein domain protein [Vittaforma corneae ATCC 50505]|uniref:Small GTP-binding protein domain protein n=1 Tax=Vittaforma corneae (strain ATCC 50505) TaxID=993615 RepID=L2GM03_VITCO|nr:small GTP-binding protein domain protein [Vittaforma corneae ATCC 50505]ELA41876.1 small GTP-binding protein domain protein [Vittaforma corneae ATCC 50505]